MLTLLALSGGLLVATKMVQTNQENRGNAVGSTVYTGYSVLNNTLECRNAGGICATFNTASTSYSLYKGTCSVNGVSGTFITGKCAGDWRTTCCNTGTSCYVGNYRIPNGAKFCNTLAKTRVYVCNSGNIVYQGLDCSSRGKICENGNCVTKLSGTDAGAEKCVIKGGNCQTNYASSGLIVTPSEGTVCMIGNKLGTFKSGLCSGKYITGYRCCVPN
ncbi:MAG: hypothetical protein PHE32_01265 [Candidatus Shapirobacteria bacterium]|nr:hypothetical protein [Candidatus Shapirobacteria bacterium]